MQVTTRLTVLTIVLTGCNASKPTDRPDTTEQEISAAQTIVPENTHASDEPQPPVGRFYKGDGLGLNLDLTLNADGTFLCIWTGCLGEYGRCSGNWRQSGNLIHTDILVQDGKFRSNSLGDLELAAQEGKPILIQTHDRSLNGRDHHDRHTCFVRFSDLESFESDQP